MLFTPNLRNCSKDENNLNDTSEEIENEEENTDETGGEDGGSPENNLFRLEIEGLKDLDY